MTRHHALLSRDMTTSGFTVAIKLQGKHGRGRSMVLDELDWSRVRLVVGEVWNVSRAKGREYVMTFVGKDPSNPLKGKTVKLARWLTWAEPGEVVSYRDGDPLNLTRANLMTTGRREFLASYMAARSVAGEAQASQDNPAKMGVSGASTCQHSGGAWVGSLC